MCGIKSITSPLRWASAVLWKLKLFHLFSRKEKNVTVTCQFFFKFYSFTFWVMTSIWLHLNALRMIYYKVSISQTVCASAFMIDPVKSFPHLVWLPYKMWLLFFTLCIHIQEIPRILENARISPLGTGAWVTPR